jgi:plasmid stability protein
MIIRGVPVELRRELKILAASEGKSMTSLIIEAVRDLIEKYRSLEEARASGDRTAAK